MGPLARLRCWVRALRGPVSLGRRGERAAARYLRRRGMRVVARGQETAWGELDLVAVEGRTVVFVEVKTRTSQAAGHPAEAVDRQKQRRITREARAFLARHRLEPCAVRFDVVAVTWPENARRPAIEHFVGAFEAAE